MRGNEFLDKMSLIDPAYIDGAEVVPKRKRLTPVKKLLIAAACVVLMFSVGFGTYAYAAEAREYKKAVQFFNDYVLSTDGLTREEIKNVYRDITSNSFSDDKTIYVIATNISPDMIKDYVVPNENATPEEVENFWNYRNSGMFPIPEGTSPIETPVETPVETPPETEPLPRRCQGMHKYELGIINEGSCTEERTMGNICVNCGWSYVTEKLGKVHTFGEYVVTVPMTCESDGLEVSECTGCGIKDEKIIPASHTLEADNCYFTSESTCKEHGFIDYYCAVCGEDARYELPLAEHSWDITEKAPTCEFKGEKVGICTVCDKTTTFEAYPNLGHEYVQMTYNRWFCTRCYAQLQRGGSQHILVHTVWREASCTEEGMFIFECSHCDLEVRIKAPEKGHVYSKSEYEEPTCTEEGFLKRICDACGHTDSEEYPKTDHNFECVEGTKYKCTECGVEKS